MYILGNILDMKSKVSKWGNSLGLRIPQALAELMGIDSGDQVKIEYKKGSLVISPIEEEEEIFKQARELIKDVDLEEMASRVTPENMPDIQDDAPVGKEIW